MLAQVCAIILWFAAPIMAQDRTQARSMVISRGGIVATSQTLASQAGAQVLARGGSAMDAAIAANAVLTVVEPMMNGIGGDLFAIYREAKTGRLHGINASGWSPKGLTTGVLRDLGHYSMPSDGIHSVTVPGCVDGWEKLHAKFGRLAWAELFQPAIHFADQGYPVTEIIQEMWADARPKLAADENARRVLLVEGRAPEVGEVFRNRQLAKALREIASGGAATFYKGPIAKALLETSRRLRGTMEAADLAEFQAEWVEPISTDYRGWRVYELPPNGQGIAALEMLNIMERFPIGRYEPSSAEALHLKIEAQKLAYADLGRFVADPRFSQVPVAGLLAKPYAAERAKLIDASKAACSPAAGNPLPATGDTIYLSVVDREGNIASLIQSVYLSFGTGIVVDDYGFHLHNRGALFHLDERHPNALAPRKRPFTTIIPGFMERGDLHIGFGIMGGLNQAQAHAQWVSNFVDHRMNIQAALEAPRFTKLNFSGCDFMIENRFPKETIEALRAMGHYPSMLGGFSSTVGGGQAVMHDSKEKVNYGASSPRRDGAAVPEPEAYFPSAPARGRKR
jgi:gamma-glutamyltranspeptidase/glutathione hydrolase